MQIVFGPTCRYYLHAGAGITVANFLMDALFLIVVLCKIDLSNYKLWLFTIPLMYVVASMIENKYYLDNDRYKICIEKYSPIYSGNSKIALAIFACFLFFGSVALFIYIGFTYSKAR